MKVHVPSKKREIAEKAEIAFKNYFTNYVSGDFSALGEICNSMCVLKEFFLSNHFRAEKGHIVTYMNKVFDKHIVLILSNGEKRFCYTRNNLIKFIRGEAKHGDSENKDDKRLALHTFTFETTTEFTYEFGISANWIVGPNLRRAEGNFDSENAFVHEVNLARGKQRLTFMESVIFHTAYEFWQTCTNQKPVWQPKCRVSFNPDDFVYIWGKDVVTNIKEQEPYWVQNLSSTPNDHSLR